MAEREIPERIGPYRIERTLGEGGMGVVYAGVGPGGEPVAIKVLRVDLGPTSTSVLRRFEQEARIRLEHPHVVRVLAAGRDEATGVPYIAFERLEGASLDELLRQRARLPVAEAVDLALQAARGLVPAHLAGIIHRDIKPSNLFVCGDGTVKVLDFGIARVASRDTRLTAEGAAIGTVAYFSPEQARGEDSVDGRSDVWSLGVVLYEALCGRNPFDRGEVIPTMLAVLADRPAALSVVAPHVPGPLSALVERCLRPSPEDRFRNAAALVEALEALGVLDASEPPSAEAPTEILEAVGPPSIRPGEARLVALLLATDVGDRGPLEAAIRERAGLYLPLPAGRAVGVFGGERWEGDEVDRAVDAAVEARSAVGAVAVAAGRATYSGSTGITGSVLKDAQAGCDARLPGVAISAEARRVLAAERPATPVTDALFELPISTRGASVPPPASDAPAGPMIGRDAELAQLRRATCTAFEEGRPSAVVAVGTAGMGKTRLRQELSRLLVQETPEPPTVLLARAEPLHAQGRLTLFASLLLAHANGRAASRGWPRLSRSSPAADRRDALRRLAQDALGDDQRAREHEPFLGELLGVPMPSDPRLEAARRDPRLMTDRLRLAVLEWLQGLTEQGPVALLLEDLQWADEASYALLEDFLEAVDGAVLLLVTARPEIDERCPGLLSDAGALRIELRGLMRAEVKELAQRLAGAPLGAELVERLAEHTGGNPFFVEQTVIVLRDTERLSDARAELPLPATIEAAVQGRLDHLPDPEKELCKRAAILERRFSERDLQMLGIGAPVPALAELVRRQLLAARGRGRGPREYAFRSQLVQDVAYRMVAEALRADLHRRLAQALEAEAGADPGEIARHWERSGSLARAAEAYARAAIFGAEHGDAVGVVAHAERALSLGAPGDRLYALHRARSDALESLGRLEEQDPHLSQALALAPDEAARARVLGDRAVWLQRAGRTEEAIDVASAAIEAARAAGDADALALALGRRAFARIYARSLDEAEVDLREAERLAEASAPRVLPFAAAWRAQLASARGDHGQRREAYERAVALYEEAGDLRRAAGAELNLADAFNRVGAYDEAERALRAVVGKCERIASRLWEGYARLNLAYALNRLGRDEEAIAELEQADELARQTKEVRLGRFVCIYRCRAVGRQDPAAAAAEAEVVAEDGDPALEILARTVASEMQRRLGRLDAALASSSRAMERLEELGGVEEDEAEVFLAHAQALEASGRSEEAALVRERGRRRVEEVADLIVDEAWRRRFLHDVPAHRELVTEPDGGDDIG